MTASEIAPRKTAQKATVPRSRDGLDVIFWTQEPTWPRVSVPSRPARCRTRRERARDDLRDDVADDEDDERAEELRQPREERGEAPLDGVADCCEEHVFPPRVVNPGLACPAFVTHAARPQTPVREARDGRPDGYNSRMAAVATGERRIVSVLIADVVNSTGIGEKLGPERSKFLMDEVLRIMTAQIRRYDGTVVQRVGDEIFAIFGAPVAHEDDPERAVRAALAIQRGGRPLRGGGLATPTAWSSPCASA